MSSSRSSSPASSVLRRCLLLAAFALSGSVAASAQAPTDIYILPIDRTESGIRVLGEPLAVTDRDGYDNQPYFTAAGALLYTSIRGGQADTYRHDPSTGEPVRVTATPESEYSPTPMPDSDRFSVVRVEADSTQRLWSFAADGTDPRLLLEDVAPVGYHAWAGDRVALFVLGDPPTLRLADPATGRVEVVAERIGRAVQTVPGGVPGGVAVSFSQELSNGWVIRELRVADGAIRTLAPMLGPDEYHTWTPAGDLLTAHGTRVLRHDDITGDWRPVVDLGAHGLGAVTRLAVSPDGGTLAVVVDRPVEP